MNEIWKSVMGYPGYEVSNIGRIRSPNKILKLRDNLKYGHLTVCLCDRKRKPRSEYVHTLVLEAFVGPRTLRKVSRHIDGDPQNNCVSNLVWGTRKENYEDARRHGTAPRGERHGHAILTAGIVRRARRMAVKGQSIASISRQLGVNYGTIGDAIRGRRWGHIPGSIASKRQAKAKR